MGSVELGMARTRGKVRRRIPRGRARILPEMDDPRPTAIPPPPPPPARAPLKPVAWRHYLWVVGAVLVVALALHWLGPILTPFLIGAILAYLGKPVVDRLARRGVSRTLGAAVVVLTAGVLIAGLLVVLVPLVQAEI